MAAFCNFLIRLVVVLVGSMIVLVPGSPACAESGFVLHATTGLSWQDWSSGFRNAPVPMESESLRALQLKGRLSWRGRTLFSLAHTRALDDSSQQEQMLASSGRQKNSLEETLGILDLLAWVAGMEQVRSSGMGTLNRLLGLRVSYTHDLHHGRTASFSDFTYLDFSGIENAIVFENGEQLAFRTLFRDLRILTPVWYDPIYPGAVMRVGYFRSRWEKVTSMRDHYLNGLPVVQDTRRDTSGLSISYDNSLDWPGVGWGGSVDVGLFGTGLTTPGNDGDEYKPTYSAFRGEIRWNLGRDDGQAGLAATFGLKLEWRAWQQSGFPIDQDYLAQVFGRVGFDLPI